MTRTLHDVIKALSCANRLRIFSLSLACTFLMPAAIAASEPSAPVRIVFGLTEPLYPTGNALQMETLALDRALAAFQRVPKAGADIREIAEPLEDFVREYPDSVWRTAIQTNLGLAYYRAGYFTRAKNAFEDAWTRGKHANQPGTKELVDRAVGELAAMLSRLGRGDELSALLASIGTRPMSGPATELLTGAREATWMFQHEPGVSFLCGPMALKNLLLSLHANQSAVQRLDEVRSGPDGLTFAEVSRLAQTLGLQHQVIRRKPGEPIPVPSIVNWKLNHFAAIVEQVDGRFHVKDPTFGTGDAWISAAAIDEEASGYFLVPASGMSARWQGATAEEMAAVHGKGRTNENDDSATKAQDETIHPVCESHGMCVANAKEMLVSLHLTDIPVGYRPPVGPPVMVQLVYNQREAGREANAMFFSVGQKWTMNFQSWIEDDPNAGPNAKVVRYPPSGGYVDYSQAPDFGEYGIDPWGGRFRRRPAQGPASSYEYVSPDGTRFVYGYSDGAVTGKRRIFLTEIIDSHGKALHLEYAIERDGDKGPFLRLKAILDASGRRTTFEYEPGTQMITKITDPFDRSAHLDYYTHEYLRSITDVVGLKSSFTYKGQNKNNTFVPVCMSTETGWGPWGDLTIGSQSTPGSSGSSGTSGTVVIVVLPPPPPMPPSTPVPPTDSSIETMTTPYGTTSFTFGQDLVENSRFLTIQDPECNVERVEFRHKARGIPASELQVPRGQGLESLEEANKLLDYRNSFYWDKHATGLEFTDARITHWLHTGLHQTEMKTAAIVESRKQPGESRVWYVYPGQEWPATVGTSASPSAIARVLSDGSTQKVGLEYNDLGQVRKLTDPLGRVTEFVRDTNGLDLVSVGRRLSPDTLVELRGFAYDVNRRLTQVRIAGGNQYDYSYDDQGRLKTRTDKAGRVDIYTHNDLNQLKRIDIEGTDLWKTFDYDTPGRLWKETWSDGYVLVYEYDALDRLTKITYPDNSKQQFIYKRLDLFNVIPRNGPVRVFAHDANRRLTGYSDGKNATILDYYENGVLKSVTVDGNKKTRWSIDRQGRPTVKTYPDGSQEHYYYDPNVSLLNGWTSAAGYRTSYKYNADGSLQSIRQTNRNSPPDLTVLAYDDPYFLRLTSVTKGPEKEGAPTQAIKFEYYPPFVNGEPQLGAHQLHQEWINGVPHGPAYTYDSIGRLETSTLGKSVRYEYDKLSRVKTYHGLRDFDVLYYPDSGRVKSISADLLGTGFEYKDSLGDGRLDFLRNRPGHTYGYTYDPSGNITGISETRAGETATAQWQYGYDEIGRIVLGGKEPNLSSFDHDGAGNLTVLRGRSASYNSLNQVKWVTGWPPPPDTPRKYVYDTSNRLVEIIYSGGANKHTRISYDALGRISSIADQSRQGFETWRELELTWCGLSVCQETSSLRFGPKGPIGKNTRSYFYEGHQDSRGGNTYYLRDHLGSVRETISDTGKTLAAYDYDPYGKSLSGSPPAKGFAGMYFHEPSGLYFTRNRVFDPELGRWLTRDPIGEQGGLNLYTYADGNPISYIDPSGLRHIDVPTSDLARRTGKLTFFESLKEFVQQTIDKGGADSGHYQKLKQILSSAKNGLSKAEYRRVRRIAKPGLQLRCGLFDPVDIIVDAFALIQFALGDDSALDAYDLKKISREQGDPEYLLTDFGPIHNPYFNPISTPNYLPDYMY